MVNRFFDWLQNGWGAGEDGSFGNLLESSLNFWGLLEATHLLTLMLFFGTILVVDLRLLGLAFTEVPVSTVHRRLLPLTIFAMVMVLATGLVLFVAKAELYWHNLWFRTKMVALAAAIANVAVYHRLVERDEADWDLGPTPRKAKISAALSLAAWLLVMGLGRFTAYGWFYCGKQQPAWVNLVQDCAGSRAGALTEGR
jgi:hypothetical protein